MPGVLLGTWSLSHLEKRCQPPDNQGSLPSKPQCCLLPQWPRLQGLCFPELCGWERQADASGAENKGIRATSVTPCEFKQYL